MRHAFLIEAHTNWNQLKTLITLLDDSRSSIYVHVDAKSKDFDPDFFEGSVKRGTLHFVHRIPVAWGVGGRFPNQIGNNTAGRGTEE